nr:MAG TPA: holin [Caudoviricetes sp.]
MGLITAVTGLFTKGVIGSIFDGLNKYLENKRILKDTEMTARIKLMKASTEAKVQLMKAGLAADFAWENTAQAQSGWKDEWWTVVFTIPFVLSFYPPTAQVIHDGFMAISAMPDWYMGLSSVVIGSAFGIRSIAKIMNLKSGVNLANIDTVKDLVSKLDATPPEKK